MAKVWNYESKKDDPLSRQVAKDPTITYTKPEMARYLISRVNLRPGDIVMEPCRGLGAFYDNLPPYVSRKWCEDDGVRDYLEYGGRVDITLSNPPFVPRKLFVAFHEKAMETTKREIWWLINCGSLNCFTPKRLEEMKTKQWFLKPYWVVQDKRWHGRYFWVKIDRNPKGAMVAGWNKRVF